MNLRAARIVLVALLALEIALLVFGPQARDHLPGIAAADAAGKRPDWWDDAAMGVRSAAWINAGLLAVLLASAAGWTRPLPSSHLPSPISHLPSPKWFWPLVAGAAVLSLGLRLPLASKSLWWDEAWVIKEAGHGKWLPDKRHEGGLRFMAHDWKRCAWYYQKPTNHTPMSLLQKASITAWQKITGSRRSDFSDLAARVPALLASMAAVILLACLLRAWGKPGAGVCAAFVLALHPWHIRYGVDARAYALVVPLCVSGMFAVTRLAESGGRQWWPWAWWGATEFLWLWAFPNALFDITALNIVAAVLLWKSHAGGHDRWTVLLRLLATNVLAAILFIQMFLPNLMQARRWAGQEADKHVLDLHLASETLSYLFFGHPFWFAVVRAAGGAPGKPGSAQPFASGLSAICFMVLVSLAFAIAIDLLFVARRRPGTGVPLLATLAVAGAAFCAASWSFQAYFYPRFLIALLPVFIAAICLLMTGSRWPKLASGMMVTAFLIWFAAPLSSLLSLPIAPLHDVARFVRAQSAGKEAPPIVACYGLGREVMPVYEPRCVPLENRADVAAAMDRAKTEHRDLFVTYGYNGFNRAMLPDGFALLDDKSLFEEVTAFAGIEPDFFFRVLRMK